MSWSTAEEIRARLVRRWESGRLLRPEQTFPLTIKLKGPSSRELSSDFGKVADWVRKLQEQGVPLVYKEVRHRVIGTNQVPTHARFESLEEACAFARKSKDLRRFQELREATRERCPQLLEWVEKRGLKLLELGVDWERMLDVVDWYGPHGKPGLYLRQVDLPGIDTKFLEGHKKTLGELFRLVSPAETPGAETFEEEFGFKARPSRIRFRLLDVSPSYPPGLTDLAVPVEELARLDPGLKRAFIVENEVNFLAFPKVEKSLVFFGSGYNVGVLKQLDWLRRYDLYYWGDIDTHGFAILNRLRHHFPRVESLLMDRDTLLAHRAQCVTEPQPTAAELDRLNDEEQALYQDLLHNRLGERLRLEQELIGFGRLLSALRSRVASPCRIT